LTVSGCAAHSAVLGSDVTADACPPRFAGAAWFPRALASRLSSHGDDETGTALALNPPPLGAPQSRAVTGDHGRRDQLAGGAGSSRAAGASSTTLASRRFGPGVVAAPGKASRAARSGMSCRGLPPPATAIPAPFERQQLEWFLNNGFLASSTEGVPWLDDFKQAAPPTGRSLWPVADRTKCSARAGIRPPRAQSAP
jgi:hypothetical protein